MTRAEYRNAWVILVTEGTILEFAPELYLREETALREGERWAATLSLGDPSIVRRPFEGRWEVGYRDVRLVRVEVPSPWRGGEPWVGTHWSPDGYPDPEAVMLEGRLNARRWAESPVDGASPDEVIDTADEVVATFRSYSGDEYSRVTRLKEVSSNTLIAS